MIYIALFIKRLDSTNYIILMEQMNDIEVLWELKYLNRIGKEKRSIWEEFTIR